MQTNQKWAVGVLTEDQQHFVRTSHETFDTQEAAEGYAKWRCREKPFMHFVARPE